MRRFKSVCILGLFLATVLATPGMSQTAEQVLAKMIDAQGGRAALAKIEDMTLTGTLEIVSMGINGSLTMYQKEPNKMRMDMEFMGMVMSQAFDGENAWGVDPSTGSVQDLPEDQAKEFKRMALGNKAILNPKEFGITFTFKGKETIEGKDYLLLEQTYDDGEKQTLYLDADTYLLYKSKSMSANMAGMKVDTETFSSDYRKVDGLMVAHSMRIVQEGEESMVMTFTEVSFNTGLEDSLFKKE
jgi:outer membrane lipoprotein-sorting protein